MRDRREGTADPGPGWLRSRFMGQRWPRPCHAAPCGRPECSACQPTEQADAWSWLDRNERRPLWRTSRTQWRTERRASE
jgi:hypothetical protein